MADGTVEYLLRLRDEASAALGEVSDAARDATTQTSSATEAMERLEEQEKQVATEATRAQTVLSEFGSSVDKSTPSVSRMTTSTRDLGYATQSVAMQLPDVITQLQMGVSPAQVFSQQGLQVVQMNMGLVTAAAKGLVNVLKGPWGIAITAAVTGAYHLVSALGDVSDRAKKLKESFDAAQEALTGLNMAQLRGGWTSYEDVLEGINIALAKEQGLLTDTDIAIMARTRAIRQQAQALIDIYQEQITTNETIQAGLDVQLQSRKLNEEETLEALAWMNQIRKLNDALRDQQAATKAQMQNDVALVAAQTELAASTGALTDDADELTDTVTRGTDAIVDLKTAMLELSGVGSTTHDNLTSVQGAIDRINASTRGVDLSGVYQGLSTKAGADLSGLVSGSGADVSTAFAAITDTSGMLAALGPAGAVLSGLQAIGAAGGAAGIEEQLQDLSNNILSGIDSLPKIISEVIPEFVETLLTELPEALIKMLPEIIEANIKALWELIKFLKAELPGILLDAFVNGLKAIWDMVKDFFTGLFSLGDPSKTTGEKIGNTAIDIVRGVLAVSTLGVSEIGVGLYKHYGGEMPRFASGTSFVDHTGLALVHEGEQIIPRGGLATQAAGATTYNQRSSSLNITGFVGPDAINELDRLMRIHSARGLTFGG